MHNIQKYECCQISHFNAERFPSRKHCCAGSKESAHSKYLRWDSDQDGREQRSVHNGHVDLHRRNRSSFQLAGTVSGQTAFDKCVRLAALCRGETAENRKLEEDEETELNGIEEGQDQGGETELTVKKKWQRQIGAGGQGPETNRHRNEKGTQQHTYRSGTGVHTA